MKRLFALLALTIGLNSFAQAGLVEGLAAIKAKDYAEGFKQLSPIAEQGDLEAQHNLGRLYAYGLGTPKDGTKALYWYTKAANQGYAPAQYGLGVIYSSGDGVPMDDVQAVSWWRKAADQGNANAQHALAIMYAGGHGVPKDYAQAVAWYRKAIESGSVLSVFNLGLIYANGAPGIAKNLPMAYVIFSLGSPSDASSQGYKGIVAARLEPEQLKQANALVSAWKPGTPLPQM
ncbi:tetratricopeptide repeat protein [Undibacterium sp.]|jgi:TPR repeat protein|uniref:tetratricopeptide repeat protein n=1 Tax=Undibacterium sp. TaxID=1914977 RepID=UPI002D007841|nr:tetratricopeptide repeat protein [Undibacterium sp.]HTD03779.1 tetratricopeptide repeat protein [Undibacterium sp.]